MVIDKMSLTEIRSDKTVLKRSADKLLQEASQENFETVIIFGFINKRIKVLVSAHHDYLKIIGALEEAKNRLIQISNENAG